MFWRPAVLAFALLAWSAVAGAQKFYPDDPLEREPPPLPAVDPGSRNLSLLLEAASATFGRPGERHPTNGVIQSQGINTLGEVLDGPWFVNRHGRTRLSLAALRAGSGDAEPPSMATPWRVLLIRRLNARPTIVVRDENNRVYLLRFDPKEAPELATGADMVGSRVFHALGYNVPETYLVAFTRDRLVIDENASDVTSFGALRALLPEDLDRLLEAVARRRDGSYRAVAMKVPTEASALIGPFQMFGTRSDDPNDIVPHEHRRDLRGLQVFAAWLNHTRMGPLQTFDIVVEPPGEPRHIRHYLIDFMGALGSGITGPKSAWEGHEPVYAQSSAVRNLAGMGLYAPAWMRASYPDLTGIGRFESRTFEPEKWIPLYDTAPFANRLPDDTYWAARQVMAFTDDDIRAIVEVGQYSDPAASRWIADRLIDRRDKIGRTYFSQVLPLDDIAVRNGEMTFVDRAVERGFTTARGYRVEWWTFDNTAGKPAEKIGPPEAGLRVPAAVASAAPGAYVLARVTAEGTDPGLVVSVYLRNEPAGLRVVGLDREWPGRVLVDPRRVVPPESNRYASFDNDRQNLFVTYTRSLNARTGQTRTPEERFRELSPSEQTTFDGVTHALMRSMLTDASGQSLGRALDLLAGVERIAGEQSGRSGDQQFRLFVILKPEARDTLERSREFVKSHENTVYHVGYPHSYRLGAGEPSVQFSVAEDGLSADVDVDYRASKAPQSLFNGHLTASNSDVRAGNNAKRHDGRWNGFPNWWSGVFGGVKFPDVPAKLAGPFGTSPTRPVSPVPPNRPADAVIPDVADAMQEFFTDWLIRRNFQEAAAMLAPDVYPCVADSLDMNPKTSPEHLRQASVQLLEKTANTWGRPHSLTEAMNPVLPWSPVVRIVKHAYEQDFAIVEPPDERGAQFECGAPAPKTFQSSATPQQYGTYYGALLQVVQDGQPGGTIVFLWRRVSGNWRLVAYRVVD